MVLEVGVTDKLKPGAGMTTSVTEVVCVVAPLRPIIVSGYVPGDAVDGVEIVSCASVLRATAQS
jgi:hypothetical protein